MKYYIFIVLLFLSGCATVSYRNKSQNMDRIYDKYYIEFDVYEF